MTNGDARAMSDGAGGGGPTKPDAAAVTATEALAASDTRLTANDGSGGGGPTKIRAEAANDGQGGGGPTKIRDTATAPVVRPETVDLAGDGAGGGGPTGPHK